MVTRERPADRGQRLARQLRATIAGELRTARLSAGLSQAVVADAAGMPRATYSRIERAAIAGNTLDQYARAAAALGLNLSMKLYPGGAPIRDAGQLALLGRFRARIHPTLRIRTEVPIPLAGDLRAWDLDVSDPNRTWWLVVDGEMRLHDIQAQTRRIELKRRDSGATIVILLVANTRANRQALAAARELLREQFPEETRAVLAALANGRCPDASGIVIL